MKLSVLLTSAAAASAFAAPHGPGGKPGRGGPKGDKEQPITTPALFEGSSGCTYPVPDPKFKVDKYLGKWYQVAGYTFRETEGAKCVTAQYSLNEDGTVKVINTSLGPDGEPTGVEGTATPREGYGKGGAFTVEFPFGTDPSCPGPNYIVQQFGGEYSIVQTQNWDTLFLLSREKEPEERKVQKWIDNAVNLGSNRTQIVRFSQEGCE